MGKKITKTNLNFTLIPLAMVFTIIGLLFFNEQTVVKYLFLFAGLILAITSLFLSVKKNRGE